MGARDASLHLRPHLSALAGEPFLFSIQRSLWTRRAERLGLSVVISALELTSRLPGSENRFPRAGHLDRRRLDGKSHRGQGQRRAVHSVLRYPSNSVRLVQRVEKTVFSLVDTLSGDGAMDICPAVRGGKYFRSWSQNSCS